MRHCGFSTTHIPHSIHYICMFVCIYIGTYATSTLQCRLKACYILAYACLQLFRSVPRHLRLEHSPNAVYCFTYLPLNERKLRHFEKMQLKSLHKMLFLHFAPFPTLPSTLLVMACLQCSMLPLCGLVVPCRNPAGGLLRKPCMCSRRS